MSATNRQQYRTAGTVSFIDNEIGVIRICGIVTPDTSIQLLRDNADWLAANDPMGQVAYYDSAAMAVDAQILLRNASQAGAENPALACPTALVVNPGQLELFSTYCRLISRSGISRAAFVDPQSARDWATRQARLHAHRLEVARRAAPRLATTGTSGIGRLGSDQPHRP